MLSKDVPMNPFLLLLSQKTGLSETSVQAGLAALLGLLKERAEGPDFEKVLDLIPGARDILAAAPAAPEGLLGGIFGAAGGFLGGQAGDAVKALSAFQRAGIPADKIAPFAQCVFDQVRNSGGTELVGKIAESIPALKALLGGR